MDPMEKGSTQGVHEVVFVLRLRAMETGWWGQVRRMDTGSARSVAGLPDLFSLLERDWHLAIGRTIEITTDVNE